MIYQGRTGHLIRDNTHILVAVLDRPRLYRKLVMMLIIKRRQVLTTATRSEGNWEYNHSMEWCRWHTAPQPLSTTATHTLSDDKKREQGFQ